MWQLIPQPVKNEYQELINEYIDDAEWNKIEAKHFDNFIRGEHITWQQWLILLAVERAMAYGETKISVVSGHGIGKDACLSWLVIWFLFCYLDAQIGTTAPTSEQMHDILWKELKLWLDRMPKELSNLFEWQTGYLRIKERAETWFARARTARKETPEAIAGLHGQHVFIGVDEASGVPDEIYKSAEGSLTGENILVLLIGNGVRNTGYFYNTHSTDKTNWQILSFNSEDSPIVERAYIERMLSLYGRESDEYKIRVLGKFPATEQMDERGFIPLVNKVQQGSDIIPFVGRKKLGIDPSGEGDNETIWVLRDNFQSRVIDKEQISNDKSIARKTLFLIEEYGINPSDVVIGAFGAGMNVRAELLLLNSIMNITAVNENEKPDETELYLNKRAEMCFRARSWLAKGGQIVGDELKREIEGFVYKINLSGKKQIIDKPNLIKRIGKSPDRADAFFLTFYEEEQLISQAGPVAYQVADPHSAI